MKYATLFSNTVALGSLLLASTSFALSPPNLTADIKWDVDPLTPGNQNSAPGIAINSVEAIEAAYNNARRQEEIQLRVITDALGTLDLPEQAVWDIMTPSEKALYITNAERGARDGVLYPGFGTVLGLPLEAVESHLNKLAQDYAEYMVANNFWAHNVPDNVTSPPFAGTGSFTRIGEHPVIGNNAGSAADCRQFMARAENLAIFGTSLAGQAAPETIVETSIYSFLYDDAGSNWGHREAQLLQDQTLSGQPWGFNNDHGPANSEGFMGIGIAGRSDGSYSFFNGADFPSQWALVWLVMDPSPESNCNYGIARTKELPNLTWQLISLPASPPASANTVADIFGDDIAGTYASTWQIWSFDETVGAAGGYVDPGINGVLQAGKGYWIIQGTGESVTLDMPIGSKQTPVTSSDLCSATSPQGCLSLPLTAKATGQWNMPGNPFYTNPSIDKLRVSTSVGICADSDGCSIAEATDPNGAGLQNSQYFSFNGTGYDILSRGDKMQAWDGFWNLLLSGANGIQPRLHIPRN